MQARNHWWHGHSGRHRHGRDVFRNDGQNGGLLGTARLIRIHLFVFNPRRHDKEYCRRQNHHLDDWNKANHQTWDKRHLFCVCPTVDETNSDPFDNNAKAESDDQHHAVMQSTGIDKPIRPLEREPADCKDDPHEEAIAHACNKAMHPSGDASPIHSNKKKALSDFPKIVDWHGDDEQGRKAPYGRNARWTDFHRHGPRLLTCIARCYLIWVTT